MTTPTLVVLGLVLLGCGGSGSGDNPADASVDAFIDDPLCWPIEKAVPMGTAVLGTGRPAFQPMPTELPIEYGTQDGFNLVANVMMTGLHPGDPKNLLDPTNPRTRLRTFFNDTNMPLNRYADCPFRYGYKPSPSGNGFEPREGIGVIFEVCWRAQHLIGKQVRIEMELMDRDGGYAKDTIVVTLAEPLDYYPVEADMPGCPPL